MYNNETFHNMRVLIVAQHSVAIKRTYLLDNSTANLFSSSILVFASSILVGTIIYDIFYLNISFIYSIVIFEILVSLEATYLMSVAVLQTKTFDAIKMLDEKCLFSNEYSSKIEAKSLTVVILGAMSIITDVVGMWTLQLSSSAIVVLTMSFALHDSEIGFYSVLISAINLRLFGIIGANINHGSKVYRHVLLIASHFEKEFNLSILIMLGVTFVSTVVYALVIYLTDSSMKTNVAVFLMWRELKSLFCLWSLCSSAAQTKLACGQIIDYLSMSLVFDFKKQEDTLRRSSQRLLSCVKAEKPRYVNGSILSIDLGVPLHMVDISVNYLLIILQIYVAYVMKH